MNDLEYLNQISAGVSRPAENTGFFDKRTKIISIIVGGILLLAIILMVAFSSSASNQPTELSELTRLYHYSNSVEKLLNTYSKSVKSSSLRSATSSLSTILAEAKSTTNATLAANEIKLSDDQITPADAQSIATSNQVLESARLNGILDRKFASEIHYHIEYLLIIETSVEKKTKDPSTLGFLSSSKDSLSRLSTTFDSFSESN